MSEKPHVDEESPRIPFWVRDLYPYKTLAWAVVRRGVWDAYRDDINGASPEPVCPDRLIPWMLRAGWAPQWLRSQVERAPNVEPSGREPSSDKSGEAGPIPDTCETPSYDTPYHDNLVIHAGFLLGEMRPRRVAHKLSLPYPVLEEWMGAGWVSS